MMCSKERVDCICGSKVDFVLSVCHMRVRKLV